MNDMALPSLADGFAPLSVATAPPRMAAPSDFDARVPSPHPLPATIRHYKLGVPAHVWPYLGVAGELLFAVCRFDKPDGKEVLPYTYGTMKGRTGWFFKAPPSPRALYRLNVLAARPDAPVLLVEGEKAADAAAILFPDTVPTASQGGSKAAGKADWSAMSGRAVTIWPDHDEAGATYATIAGRMMLKAGAASVRIVRLPAGFPPAWDVADKVPDGVSPATLGELLAEATPFVDTRAAAGDELARLFVNGANLPGTAEELRDHLASRPHLFDRGVPVRLAHDAHERGMRSHPLGADGVVREAHRVVQPWKFVKNGDAMVEADVTLPDRVARLYLDMRGEWNLRVLNGIASAPLLRDDGTIHSAEGYDATTGMWCERVPDMAALVPGVPTRAQADAALMALRRRFRTFAFADADMVAVPDSSVPVVNLAKPPGADESAFLVALLTAICRPSLPLAPGLLLRAAPMSGAGAGKGLLARCICAIAYGRAPHAVTGGATAEELEKRIGAELMAAGPVLFLDNLNAQAFKSDLLASAITERPARVRLLGKSEMMPLNAVAFVVMTGNGLTVSEDLARRFLAVELDPGTEDPEARPFDGDVLAEVTAQRAELLAAALTIWRWGRRTPDLAAGRALGSFPLWGRWCRDPLLALGCADPAERIL